MNRESTRCGCFPGRFPKTNIPPRTTRCCRPTVAEFPWRMCWPSAGKPRIGSFWGTCRIQSGRMPSIGSRRRWRSTVSAWVGNSRCDCPSTTRTPSGSISSAGSRSWPSLSISTTRSITATETIPGPTGGTGGILSRSKGRLSPVPKRFSSAMLRDFGRTFPETTSSTKKSIRTARSCPGEKCRR